MRRAYQTDLSDEEWEILEPHLPVPRASGRPRLHPLREILDAFLMRNIYGVKVSDLGSFRTIRRDDLLALEMREMTYGWPVEMMVKVARVGYRYREVPVRHRRRSGGSSKVGGTLLGSIRAGWYILSTVFRYSRWIPRESAGRLPKEVR
jgi:transposase